MKSIRFNFLMNMLLTLSAIIFPLITFPYISRILQAEGVGKVTFLTSIVTYFNLFAQLGIPTYGIRACARVRDNKEKLSKTVQEIFTINLVTTILSYGTLLILYMNIGRLREDGILFLILSLTILFNQFGMEWLYKALEQYQYITTFSLLFKLIAIVMMFAFVKTREDYIVYGAITIFALSASNVVNFINLRKHVDFFKVRPNYNFRKHLRPILTFFALSCAATIYTNLDTVMLGFMHNAEAVGYYNTAGRIRAILLSIVTSLGVVLLPRLSYYIDKGDRNKFLELSNKSFNFILLMSVAITTYFIIYSKEIIYFLAGDTFGESILPLQIILPTVIFIGMTNLFGIQILVPLGKEKYVLYSVIAGGIVNLLLNIVLIPKFAYVGTAFSNMLAELVVLLMQIYFIKDMIRDIIKGINYKIPVATIVAGFISLISVNLVQGDFIRLVISSTVFFIIYYLMLRLVKVEFVLELEKQIFNNIIRRIR